MDFELIKTAGKVAGIGGIALGGLILVLRDVIAKNIFPNLTKKQAYSLLRLIAILMWSAAILGILAWTLINFNYIKKPQVSSKLDNNVVMSWVDEAENARTKEIVHHNSHLPTSLLTSRTAFEQWWADSNLKEKEEIENKTIYDALNYTTRLYRIQELQSEKKPSSTYWADEAIRYFQETQNPYFLAESLIDKAAIFLEISQIEHTDADAFRRLAEDGDSIMSRAATLSNQDQKSDVYRIWSRFYQNLARPQNGNLAENWDNNYLLLSYDKILEAYKIKPEEMKNITQLARVTDRTAMYPPQLNDPGWTEKLRSMQELLLKNWEKNKDLLNTPTKRIPPLNIISNITMQTVRREWQESLDPIVYIDGAIEELKNVAVKSLQEVLALVRHTEWEEDYDFDLYYDLSRIYSLMSGILISVSPDQSDYYFNEVLKNLKASRKAGSATQNDAAYQSIDSDHNFKILITEKRDMLKSIYLKN